MKGSMQTTSLAGITIILAMSAFAIPNLLAQQVPSVRAQVAIERAQHQERLQQVLNDKASYAAAIVSRWEDSAKDRGKWDANFRTDLYGALMKLQPDNLAAAGEASSYDAMIRVLMSGPKVQADSSLSTEADKLPDVLGDIGDDLVYTPVTPCRIVDTRLAGGPIAANTTRSFDVDNTTSFSFQGGFNGPCGIPFNVARAVAMTITVTQPAAAGYFTAWSVGTSQPLSSVINYDAGQTLANTSIVPVLPGTGNDFFIYSYQTAHAVVDVVGYFAAPVATALDCTTANSAVTLINVNVYTAVDAVCPAGRTATGGGWYSPEGTLGYPGIWNLSLPGLAYGFNGWRIWVDNQTSGTRNVQAWALCCRVPGR